MFILLEQKKDHKAWLFAERAKSRTFADLLSRNIDLQKLSSSDAANPFRVYAKYMGQADFPLTEESSEETSRAIKRIKSGMDVRKKRSSNSKKPIRSCFP